MSSANRPATENLWFQDSRTGCEKQTQYFVQFKKLQEELIHREQHNLVNAMERLKQLTYPRKRPMIRNVGSSDCSSTQHFPARHLNLRKEAKYRALASKEKPDISPISGKPLMLKSDGKKIRREHYENSFVMPPLLNDKDIARIVHHANEIVPSECANYLLRPHLPSIPNVGRKTNFSLNNRLKLLTLAESEFTELEDDTRAVYSGAKKRLHTGKSYYRRTTPKKASKENLKSHQKKVLRFDIDPNDPILFSHCVGGRETENRHDTTPMPSPDSRSVVNVWNDSRVESSMESPTVMFSSEKTDTSNSLNYGIVPAMDEMSQSSECKEEVKILHVNIPVEMVRQIQSPL